MSQRLTLLKKPSAPSASKREEQTIGACGPWFFLSKALFVTFVAFQ